MFFLKNERLKQELSVIRPEDYGSYHDRYINYFSYYYDHYYYEQLSGALNYYKRSHNADKFYIQPNIKLCQKILKCLSLFDGCKEFSDLLIERFKMHDLIVQLWFQKFILSKYMLYPQSDFSNQSH